MAGSRTSRRRAGTRRRPATRTASRGRARGRPQAERWWPALLVVLVVLVGVAWKARGDEGPGLRTAACRAAGSSVTLTAAQASNVEAIAAVARERDLHDRAVVIALATAQQESRLRNLDYGDRDSLGLFQQRPSQGWGTPAQVRDPAYAAGEFYERLVQVPRWKTRRLTEVAQAVQRSGFPEAYQQWEPMARTLTRALSDGNDPTLDCR